MARSVSPRRQLAFEDCEQRQMMAGDVAAMRTDLGDLVIVGDARDNAIVVAPLIQNGMPVRGAYVVSSMHGGGEPTSINGIQAPATIHGVSRDMKIDLGDGNDQLMIGGHTGLNVPQNLIINLGAGNDAAQLKKVTVANEAAINTGDGNDVVVLDHVNFGKFTTDADQHDLFFGTVANPSGLTQATGGAADAPRASSEFTPMLAIVSPTGLYETKPGGQNPADISQIKLSTLDRSYEHAGDEDESSEPTSPKTSTDSNAVSTIALGSSASNLDSEKRVDGLAPVDARAVDRVFGDYDGTVDWLMLENAANYEGRNFGAGQTYTTASQRNLWNSVFGSLTVDGFECTS